MNQKASSYQSQAQPLFNADSAAIQSQLQNPGYDPTTAAAIRRSGINTANSAFDAAKFSAAERAGATGNDAMFYASGDKLAQEKAQADADAALKSEINIGQTALQSKQQAIQDASQLYNYNTTAATNLYGTGQRAQASNTYGFNIKAGPVGVGVNG